MKKFKLFLNPVEGREAWLHEMAKDGYRLNAISFGGMIYEFEESDKPKEYHVQYIGNLSNNERKEYEDMLNDMGYEHINAPLNTGNFSLGKVRVRAFNPINSSIATNPGMFSREILIIGRDKDDGEFNIFSDRESEMEDFNNRRNMYLITTVMAAAMVIYFHIKGGLAITPPKFVIGALLFFYLIYMILSMQSRINKIK